MTPTPNQDHAITNVTIDFESNKRFATVHINIRIPKYRKYAPVYDTYPACYKTFTGSYAGGCWTCLFETPCSKISKWDD